MRASAEPRLLYPGNGGLSQVWIDGLRENEPMAKPYSDDLRGKLLDAYEGGVGSLRKLAAQFCVSWDKPRRFAPSSYVAVRRGDRSS